MLDLKKLRGKEAEGWPELAEEETPGWVVHDGANGGFLKLAAEKRGPSRET